MFYDRRQRKPSISAFAGGLLAAAGVALSAQAAHGIADPKLQSQLYTAALYAFGHGVALAALSSSTTRRMGKLGLWLLLLGTLAFSGSLALHALANTGTQLAPAGGMALIVGWVLWAIDAIRR